MNEQASPRPWKAEVYCIWSSNMEYVAATQTGLDEDKQEANMKLIVDAVNSHDRLVAENERLREALESSVIQLHDLVDSHGKIICYADASDALKQAEQALKGE